MVKVTKEPGVNKDGYASGGVETSDSRGKVGIDPRSEILTNQAKVHNEINEGTQVKVQGTGAMLKSKKKTATWF